MSKHPTPSQYARHLASFTPLKGPDYTPRQLELFPLVDIAAAATIQSAGTGLETGAAHHERRAEDSRPFNQARYNHGPKRY